MHTEGIYKKYNLNKTVWWFIFF